MMEQLSMEQLLESRKVDNATEEKKAFALLYPQLMDLLHNAPMDSKIPFLEEKNDFSSVYFFEKNNLFIRIVLRKKSHYIYVPDKYAHLFPGNILRKVKSVPDMSRISIDNYSDILKYLPYLRAMLDSMRRNLKGFGCCSRYLECSNATHCIHPNPRFALQCIYFYNLRDGKIFYGDNRNI